ncbi:hypothetical protein A5880_001478 [Enterococcus sp. 4G2_DIV0659]|uniref:Uncharacterized protein n=2 Tax=Candidatus Enterococcus mansonii TaxID=1834181 RepID=A0A242CE12_9ENTE|nr:hypothetical protein A5880_001399 [Enterococcus sp. 4G2_DIV0659]
MMLLFLDTLLFLLALSMNIILFYFLVILLSFFIYKNGYQSLFKEYDESRKQKYEEYRLVQEAAKKVIRSGKLLSKKEL